MFHRLGRCIISNVRESAANPWRPGPLPLPFDERRLRSIDDTAAAQTTPTSFNPARVVYNRLPVTAFPPKRQDPDAQAPDFLDVPSLLEASEPRRPVPRLWLFLGGVIGIVLLSSLVGGESPGAQTAIEVLSTLLMLGVMVALTVSGSIALRKMRAAQQAVESISELVQLRRWTEAVTQLRAYLSLPSRTLSLRAQALVYLGAVLARYERFADAVMVYEYLLNSHQIEGGGAYGLRLGRAMAILHEDQLVDADRAITELRRMSPSGGDSAGLALLELYRDVKTGHAEEAVLRFEKTYAMLRDQLGHRSADAWGLVARAYDLLGRSAEARQAYHFATLLSPPGELFRRYPEIRKLQGRYEPGLAPPEAA